MILVSGQDHRQSESQRLLELEERDVPPADQERQDRENLRARSAQLLTYESVEAEFEKAGQPVTESSTT